MKLVLGKWAVDRVASGATPQQAATAAIDYLYTRLGGHGGIILLGPDGQIGIAHNTPAHGLGHRHHRRPPARHHRTSSPLTLAVVAVAIVFLHHPERNAKRAVEGPLYWLWLWLSLLLLSLLLLFLPFCLSFRSAAEESASPEPPQISPASNTHA